jgi:hypothetical protein
MEIKLVISLTHLCWNPLTSVCGNIKGNKHKGNNITTFTINIKQVRKWILYSLIRFNKKLLDNKLNFKY